MQATKKIYGILAEYDSPQEIFRACEMTRDAGYRRFDSFTPFPVHGLDKAMGLGPSYLPWLVLLAGITGGCLAMFFMIWTSAYDYPLNIGGKPTWSIPAFIPITFEVTVLLSGLTAVFGMMALNNLPKFYHPLFNIQNFSQVTDNKYFLIIEARDRNFDQEKITQFLNSTGARSTYVVES